MFTQDLIVTDSVFTCIEPFDQSSTNMLHGAIYSPVQHELESYSLFLAVDNGDAC